MGRREGWRLARRLRPVFRRQVLRDAFACAKAPQDEVEASGQCLSVPILAFQLKQGHVDCDRIHVVFEAVLRRNTVMRSKDGE